MSDVLRRGRFLPTPADGTPPCLPAEVDAKGERLGAPTDKRIDDADACVARPRGVQ
ncbi:hypothetical protein [Nannocystis punicea]|uniref:Uncharacterized protein n=1 Tax=Nannocystis punicea TaxID=2995304 RepID=A0ABY7HIW2_9BACT|nr:hypothetical protein [Nannocystis poenicansa]WAS99267.1 hypothetical protein O0S08_24325 [Nannocystis poenicansa]